MPFILTADQRVPLSLSVTDAYGNPATLDGTPAWDTTNGAVVTVTPSEDGMSAMVDTIGPVGTAQVNVRCDADLGDGVRELIGTLDIEVVGGEARVIALSPGAAEMKPTAQ